MSNPPQSKHHPPPSSTSAKMKQQRISPTKNTTPIIRQQKQPKKKKEDQTPAEQFFHWLTTPPEIAVVSHQEKQRKKTKQLAEYRKRQQQKQKQQQQDLTKKKTIQQQTVAMKTATEQFITKVNSTQTTTNLQQRPQPMTKEFGPLTPSQQSPKPTASGISVPGWDLDLDPPIDLPSHVPTPATIDDIILVPTSDHTLLGEKVEGAIDKTLDFIFDTKFSQKHSDSQHYNKTKKDERLHNPGVIKYAPSLETPPQSPVARKHPTATSKLLRTPPPSLSSSSPNSISATKWGPEIWEAKKSSSPTHSVTLESSTSVGDLSVSSCTTGFTFDLSELSRQEHLLREAMARKQKKEAAIRKIHPTSPTNIDGSRRSFVGTISIGTSVNPTARKDRTQPTTESTNRRTTTLSSVPTSSSTTSSASSTEPTPRSTVTTASKHTTSSATGITPTTNSLQLLWMYQNSLNLQTSCNPRRGSIRYMDGEDMDGGGGGKGNGTRKSIKIMAAGPLVFQHHDPNPAHEDDKDDDYNTTVINDLHEDDDHDEGRDGIGSIPPQTTHHAVAA